MDNTLCGRCAQQDKEFNLENVYFQKKKLSLKAGNCVKLQMNEKNNENKSAGQGLRDLRGLSDKFATSQRDAYL